MFVAPNLSSQTMNDLPLREIYVSTDIETDGPVAGKHSMVSIGSAAYLADKELLGTFSANLETLPASAPNPNPIGVLGPEFDSFDLGPEGLAARTTGAVFSDGQFDEKYLAVSNIADRTRMRLFEPPSSAAVRAGQDRRSPLTFDHADARFDGIHIS